MATHTITSLTDDIDNSDGAETVTFTYGGTAYEIDLSEKNRAAFDKAMARFVAHARKVKGKSKSKGAAVSSGIDVKSVRAWARENGFENVPDRGRLSREILDAFAAAS